ncbi:hypothetical protein [Rathayibacter sp. VKM Ac-2801]|uniref:hypothetical protein n=1 Tax=Rathayibacter sp. VKM Ac-2801 TaxID=2609255 RepID=UPI001320424F|nr:hypothetical protein [Rathayibacter sp. VKM Ac-2801]QHC71785.1 hypothetical protein GSU45_16250 [Rathayibacter sp. VKM Ac-2801]
MADKLNGQWRTTGDSSSSLVEKGLQPARVQYQPPVRPAPARIQPPPASKR